MNISALLAGAKTVANHPATKGSALATLISGGLYAALAAGIAIPTWAFTAGPLAGMLLYKVLPAKYQADIDNAETDVIQTIKDIPVVDPSYPTGKNGQSDQNPPAQTDFTTGNPP